MKLIWKLVTPLIFFPLLARAEIVNLEWNINPAEFERINFSIYQPVGSIVGKFKILSANEDDKWSPAIMAGCRSHDEKKDVKLGIYQDHKKGNFHAALFTFEKGKMTSKEVLKVNVSRDDFNSFHFSWEGNQFSTSLNSSPESKRVMNLHNKHCYISGSSIRVKFENVVVNGA